MKSIFDIGKRFPVSINNTAKVDPQPLVEPQIKYGKKQADPNTCPTCSDTEWWQPHGSDNRRCVQCDPWPNKVMAGQHYFFDFEGNRWDVEQVDGGELTTRHDILAGL